MTEQLNKNVTVWCVRYALITGIFKLTGEIDHCGIFFEYRNDRGVRLALGKKDYRLTLEEAKAAAEELRQRKIKSLEKQLDVIRSKEIGIEL